MSHAEILHALLCLDPTAVIIYYECTVPWLINLTRHISSTSEPRLNYTNLNISHDTFVIFQLKDLPANICLIYILVKEFDVQTLPANRLNPTISMIYYDISPCSTLVKISNADTLLADLRLNPTTLKYMILYIKCILYIKYSSSPSSSPSHYPVYRARPALPTSVCSAQLPDQLKRYYCFNIYGGGFYIDVITCDTYLRTQHKFDYSNVILSLSPGIEFNNDMQLLETYLVLLAGHLAGCHRVDPP